MLALARAAPRPASRWAIRSFAEIVSSGETSGTTPLPALNSPGHAPVAARTTTFGRALLKDRIPVKEDHGLYAFFRKRAGDDLVGDAKYEVVESPEAAQHPTGRAWKASELRLKSFRDLHTLWYILLRERNLLATQKEEARRMGVTNTEVQVSLNRVHQCRKSMARIKVVINERRLAYEGAVKLAEQQREEHYDKAVLEHEVAKVEVERKYLRRRLEYMARRLEAKKLRIAEHQAKERAKLSKEQDNDVNSISVPEQDSNIALDARPAEEIPGTLPIDEATSEAAAIADGISVEGGNIDRGEKIRTKVKVMTEEAPKSR